MNIKLLFRYACVALVGYCTTDLVTPSAMGQQIKVAATAEADQEEETLQIVTFQLKHADPRTVSSVMQTLLAGETGTRLAIDEARRIIVQGKPSALEKVRETLQVLDQPAEDRSQVKVFSLQYSEASKTADLITRMVDEVNVAFDVRTNSLVVSAPSEDTLNKVEALTQIIDRGVAEEGEDASYHLQLFWLIESGNTEGQAVDKSIAKSVQALARHGFDDVRQVAHVSVIVSPGGEFRIHSTEPLGNLEVVGELETGGDAQLEVELELAIVVGGDEIASVMTEFNTRPDHEVVIGIASAQNHQRRSAFVIRIDE